MERFEGSEDVNSGHEALANAKACGGDEWRDARHGVEGRGVPDRLSSACVER